MNNVSDSEKGKIIRMTLTMKRIKKTLKDKQILALFSFGMLCGGMFFIITTLILELLNLTITNNIIIIIMVICILPSIIFLILQGIEKRAEKQKKFEESKGEVRNHN